MTHEQEIGFFSPFRVFYLFKRCVLFQYDSYCQHSLRFFSMSYPIKGDFFESTILGKYSSDMKSFGWYGVDRNRAKCFISHRDTEDIEFSFWYREFWHFVLRLVEGHRAMRHLARRVAPLWHLSNICQTSRH